MRQTPNASLGNSPGKCGFEPPLGRDEMRLIKVVLRPKRLSAKFPHDRERQRVRREIVRKFENFQASRHRRVAVKEAFLDKSLEATHHGIHCEELKVVSNFADAGWIAELLD